MSNALKHKWALVTGASRGIGREIARALAAEQCHLVLHSRDIEHTRELAEELGKLDIEVKTLSADLSDPDATANLAAEVTALTPAIDILFNNAAVMPAWQEDAWAIPASELHRAFEINVVSQLALCNALVPGMMQRGYGRVINLVSGIQDQPQLAPYAITKAALLKYTEDITPALQGTGVCMNALDPGWLRTDMGSDDAPAAVTAALPGALVAACLPDSICGSRINAEDYVGMTLEDAIDKASSTLHRH